MREIKFRSWNGKRMLFMGKGGYCDFELSGGHVFEITEFQEYKRDWPLMQYTGLQDKNGVEIYEGDIVKGYGLHRSPLMEVKFEELTDREDGVYLGYWFYTWAGGDMGLIEVIGNIYANPKLLERE